MSRKLGRDFQDSDSGLPGIDAVAFALLFFSFPKNQPPMSVSSTLVGLILVTRHGDRSGFFQSPTSYAFVLIYFWVLPNPYRYHCQSIVLMFLDFSSFAYPGSPDTRLVPLPLSYIVQQTPPSHPLGLFKSIKADWDFREDISTLHPIHRTHLTASHGLCPRFLN